MTRFREALVLPLLSLMASTVSAWNITPKLMHVKKAALTVACGWALTVPAHAADVTAGKSVFEVNCVACHAGGQNMIAKERTLQKDALQKYVGLSEEAVKDFVQNSVVHRGAFVLGDKLSEKNFDDVAAYVVAQTTENKW